MIYFIIIAVVVFGVLIYLGNKRYNKPSFVIDKNYVCVPANMTTFEKELYDLINNHRRNINVSEIKNTDSFVRRLAEGHCDYMIEVGKVSHDNFSDRVASVNTIGVNFVGEVVAYGYSTPRGILNGYLNSPSHKKVIEKDKITHIGIRVMKNDSGRYYNTIILYKKK